MPAEICQVLGEIGAEVVIEKPDQPLRQRLTWRFKVASDTAVGRFLVRDVDSIINEREAWAVAQWIASDRWFHAMRDWWTHTDLLLAGMWGGVAGVLPDISKMLMRYRAKTMETPHIDQIFLSDEVWPMIRGHCLVHDRYFSPPGASGWGLQDPPANTHVGQDEFAARGEEQAMRLQDWMKRYPSLQLQQGPAGAQDAHPGLFLDPARRRT